MAEALHASSNEVQLIAVDLDARSPRYDSDVAALTPPERDRAQRIRVEWVRRRFVAARAFLRERLSIEARVESAKLRLEEGPHGKPFLAEPRIDPPLEFNLSHSAGIALVAICRGRPVGADVEHLRSDADLEALARRFFSPQERESLLALPAEDRQRAFFACWTRKEAYIKALGLGLSIPLDRFDVRLDWQCEDALLCDRGDPGATSRWRITSIDLGPSVAAAVAVAAGPHEAITYRLERRLT